MFELILYIKNSSNIVTEKTSMTRIVPISLPILLFAASNFAMATSNSNIDNANTDNTNSNNVPSISEKITNKQSINKQEPTTSIEKITVESSATANKKPVGTFDAPVSNLEYDPRVDLQSRNMAEAQADVTIRGGIFENTGFRVGSATLFDPQTGHYFSEIPIAPEMLSGPNIFTGADNALFGMNSSVGTVDFGWKPISTAGSISIGLGNNAFNLQSVHAGYSKPLDNSDDWTLGFEGEVSHSASDGAIHSDFNSSGTDKNSDHDFQRISGRVQLLSSTSQTDVFFGSQDKFFGWPNMYTPLNVNETEDLSAELFMFNHKQTYSSNSSTSSISSTDRANDSSFEITAYNRNHEDHYIFSRESPDVFQAFHETEVTSIALSGHHVQTDVFAWNYSAQYIEDSIESTTLENNFTSRNYYKVSVLPEYKMLLTENQKLTVRLGAAFDDTNRDDSQISLIGDVSWNKINTDGSSKTLYFSYAEASQVAGYTAIGGSETGGLFRSNHQLERETTKNTELGLALEQDYWTLDSAIFYRQDINLTDWTYSFDSTSARSANPVDIDSLGLELLSTHQLDNAKIITSYTFLKKSEDYNQQLGDANIDASFYALNYPDHRITLGAIWTPIDMFEVRVDNEWRKQQENVLRNGEDSAFFTHLTFKYTPEQINGLSITLAADNLWDESFEEVPGTPGRGQQFTVSATYSW